MWCIHPVPSHPIGIHAQDKYSLAYDQTHMFVWGNCVGQLGSRLKDIEPNNVVPMRFTSPIRRLTTSEWAIALSFDDSVVVLHNYQNRMFSVPNQREGTIIDISLQSAAKEDPVRLAVLTSEGIMIWTSTLGLLNV